MIFIFGTVYTPSLFHLLTKTFILIFPVTEAANGLQAWKILEDLTNHIDIVLTEVVMPCLSGVGLLCKIMSRKTRKNIPVISKLPLFSYINLPINSIDIFSIILLVIYDFFINIFQLDTFYHFLCVQ